MTIDLRPVPASRSTATIRPSELPDRAAALLANGYRLALVAGHDDARPAAACARCTCSPAARPRVRDPDRVELHVAARPAPTRACRAWPALSFPAGRFEREMRDLFGIVPGRPPARPAGWSATRTGPAAGTRCSPTPARRPRSATSRAPTRSAPSRAPASTRSRSARCTPA